MRYGAVNEEEFIEAERKRIKSIIILSSIWLLFLPPVLCVLLSLNWGNVVFFFSFLLTFIALPPFFILIFGRRKRPYAVWISWERVVFIFYKYLQLLMISVIVASIEIPLYQWITQGESYRISFASLFPLLGYVLLSFLFPLFVRLQRSRQAKFKENRNVLLPISRASAKDIIIKALDNLTLPYSRRKGLFGLPDERRFVELESGIKIGVGQNFRDCFISISDIPKNDTIEPKIEAEILRLANERVHMQESDK